MSKDNKDTTISHRALDELTKLKVGLITDIGQFKTDVIKSIQEIADKHNQLATQLAAVETFARNTAGFAAAELGKLGGITHQQLNIFGQSLNGIDVNVLALAELSREIIGQLVQIDTIFKKLHSSIKVILSNNIKYEDKELQNFADALEVTQSEINQIKSQASEWYDKLVASSFKIVQERQAKEDAQRKEQGNLAQREIQEESEEIAIENELKKAKLEDSSIATSVSGGPGTDFPDGAEIFGG